MRVSRRSTVMRTSSGEASARKRNKYPPLDTITNGRLTKRCNSEITGDLLTAVFERMRPNIWYCVVPSDGQNASISSGTRQRWEYILPLLLHYGLLEQKGEGFAVMAKKWDTFVQNMKTNYKLNFVAIRPKGELRQYYICLGKPTYTSPLKQKRDIANKNTHLRKYHIQIQQIKWLKK